MCNAIAQFFPCSTGAALLPDGQSETEKERKKKNDMD